MSNQPFISIIVPIYNVEQYIVKCITSLLNQTYTNYEIILVNDGSPDNCGQICDDFAIKSDKIKVLHLENGGVCRARNKGMEIAEGEFYCFVDSDDWVESDYLKDFADNLEDEFTLVQQDFHRDFPDNSKSFELKHNDITYNLENEFSKMITENRVIFAGFVWNKIFYSKIIKEYNILFNSNTKLADDEEFCLEYVKYIKKVRNINKANYHYIDNPYSITKRTLTFDMEYNRFQFQSLYLNFIRNNYKKDIIIEEYIKKLNFVRFEHSILRKYILSEKNNKTRLNLLREISKDSDYYIDDLICKSKGIRKLQYKLLKNKKINSLNFLINLKNIFQ